MKNCLVTVALLLLIPNIASTQNVINPKTLSFTASPDHSVTLSDGSPKVTRYEARWYAQGALEPQWSDDLGKPIPTNGLVAIDVSTRIVSLPVGAGYTCRVVAIGPTGEGVSLPSNPFEYASKPGAVTGVILSK